MTSTLLIIQFALAVVITISILLQKSSSMGLGAYSGSNESMFGAKGPGNFLAKATFILGTLFVANTLFLGYTYNQQVQKSVVDNIKIDNLVPKVPTIPVNTTNTAPSAPAAPATK